MGLLETGGVREQTHPPEGVAEAQVGCGGRARPKVQGEAGRQVSTGQGDKPRKTNMKPKVSVNTSQKLAAWRSGCLLRVRLLVQSPG